MHTPVYANDLIQMPIGPAAWTINITPPPASIADTNSAGTKTSATQPPTDSAAKKTEPLAKIEVTQDNEKKRIVTQYTTGMSTETWSLIGTNIALTEDPNGVVFFVPGGNVAYGPDAFDWLKPEFLQEKKPVGFMGKKCFHYKGQVVMHHMLHGVDVTEMHTYETWIDSETKRPVALINDGQEMGIYTFQENPPEGPLSIPAKFAGPLAVKKKILRLK